MRSNFKVQLFNHLSLVVTASTDEFNTRRFGTYDPYSEQRLLLYTPVFLKKNLLPFESNDVNE
jgi:hypothetical protein